MPDGQEIRPLLPDNAFIERANASVEEWSRIGRLIINSGGNFYPSEVVPNGDEILSPVIISQSDYIATALELGTHNNVATQSWQKLLRVFDDQQEGRLRLRHSALAEFILRFGSYENQIIGGSDANGLDIRSLLTLVEYIERLVAGKSENQIKLVYAGIGAKIGKGTVALWKEIATEILTKLDKSQDEK